MACPARRRGSSPSRQIASISRAEANIDVRLCGAMEHQLHALVAAAAKRRSEAAVQRRARRGVRVRLTRLHAQRRALQTQKGANLRALTAQHILRWRPRRLGVALRSRWRQRLVVAAQVDDLEVAPRRCERVLVRSQVYHVVLNARSPRRGPCCRPCGNCRLRLHQLQPPLLARQQRGGRRGRGGGRSGRSCSRRGVLNVVV